MSNIDKLFIKIKSQQTYDCGVVESLYTTEVDPDTGEEIELPITDVEGSTALLTDGTSWEFVDGEWQQIDKQLDFLIKNSLLPFIMEVCDSIHFHFIRKDKSFMLKNGLIGRNTEKPEWLDITGENKNPTKLVLDDFVYIETQLQMLLTNLRTAMTTSDSNVEFSVIDMGLNTRLTGDPEDIMVHLVMFPPQFLNAVADMLAYDLFEREGREVRTERLGNYTYTNFEPVAYYGEGAYPKRLEDAIKYWQMIHT